MRHGVPTAERGIIREPVGCERRDSGSAGRTVAHAPLSPYHFITLPPIHGVIFDLDGVIVRTDELHYQSWQELTAAEGIPFSRAVNQRLLGLSRAESLEIVLARAPRAYTPEQKVAVALRKQARFLELATKLTPAGKAPALLSVGAGTPVVVTVNVPA